MTFVSIVKSIRKGGVNLGRQVKIEAEKSNGEVGKSSLQMLVFKFAI